KVFSVVYRSTDKVICVSQSVKDHLVKTGEIPAEKGVVIYNPVSFLKGMNFGKDSNHDKFFNMVYVGRLEKVKNVDTLLRAFSQLENEQLRLTLVGDGRERENLENLVRELELSDKVSFEGFQSDPGKYLSVADLYVLPSYSEGFGIAAVEAMFLKVPVLATVVGGVPEFVSHSENGWLFDPNSIEDLVRKLRKILSLDDEERKAIGTKGFEDVSERFTVEKYIENLEQLYGNK